MTGALRAKSDDRIVPNPVAADEIRKVQKIQLLLRKNGYGVGEVDGVFGTRTQAAIIAFERDRGYPQSGRMTPLLLKRLNRAVPAAAARSKSPADIKKPPTQTADREDILLVQRALTDLG